MCAVKMIFSSLLQIFMLKDSNFAEKWTLLAENLKKSNSAEFVEFAFYNSGLGRVEQCDKRQMYGG